MLTIFFVLIERGNTMELYAAICDDEPVFNKEAQSELLRIRPEYRITLFSSGKELLESSLKYDIIFLDIDMPGQNGMETARMLRKKSYNGQIVFLTSHTEYMPEAFKVKAFRFLTKPLQTETLEETIRELEQELSTREKIIVNIFGTELLINVRDIAYIEARKKNTLLHLTDREIETPYPLKYWIEKLPKTEFRQTHRSFLVSFRHVAQITPTEVLMQEPFESIPLSRRSYADVKQAFFDYIKRSARLL